MLGETTNRSYLSVGFGRIRKRAKKGDEKAVERTLKDGEKTYAIEYKFISGKLMGVSFRDDPQYGKSWTLFIEDGENYAVQFSENSRYGSELLKILPNLHKGEVYKITPYDFTDDVTLKRKIGLSIKDSNDTRIDSYYQKFTETEKGWNVENLHGYPEFNGDSKDRDELKIYFIQVTKFLREKTLVFLEDKFPSSEIVTAESITEDFDGVPEQPGEDDLPF